MIEALGGLGFFWPPNKMAKLEEIHRAYQEGRITKRQHTAMTRHSEKVSSPHIRHMLKLMTHIIFAKAHKAAKEAALPESAEKA